MLGAHLFPCHAHAHVPKTCLKKQREHEYFITRGYRPCPFHTETACSLFQRRLRHHLFFPFLSFCGDLRSSTWNYSLFAFLVKSFSLSQASKPSLLYIRIKKQRIKSLQISIKLLMVSLQRIFLQSSRKCWRLRSQNLVSGGSKDIYHALLPSLWQVCLFS